MPASPTIVTRRAAYGLEYLTAAGTWSVFFDDARPFTDRDTAERACAHHRGTAVVSPTFARLWAEVGASPPLVAVA